MKGFSKVFYSNERHEDDGAVKQRVNGGLQHQGRSKALSKVQKFKSEVGQQ